MCACFLQVVFRGWLWSCTCPNIIIVNGWLWNQTNRSLRELDSPPAAVADSTFCENMQIRVKSQYIYITLHIPRWCFWGDLYCKNASYSLSCRWASWSWPCQDLVSTQHEKCCSLETWLKLKVASPQHLLPNYFTQHCISLIRVVFVKWLHRKRLT